MTLPDERYRAVFAARDFLRSLLDPKETPKIPRKIRREAAWRLKHFPTELDFELAESDFLTVFKRPMKKAKARKHTKTTKLKALESTGCPKKAAKRLKPRQK